MLITKETKLEIVKMHLEEGVTLIECPYTTINAAVRARNTRLAAAYICAKNTRINGGEM